MKPSTKVIIESFGRRGPGLVKVHGNEATRKFMADAIREERRTVGSKHLRSRILN